MRHTGARRLAVQAQSRERTYWPVPTDVRLSLGLWFTWRQGSRTVPGGSPGFAPVFQKGHYFKSIATSPESESDPVSFGATIARGPGLGA